MYKYQIKAIGPDNWRDFSTCEFGISIGNPNHEGHKLLSLLLWAEHKFDTCVVTLSDTLNRYTLMNETMNEAQAYFKTRREGELWLQRNREILDWVKGTKVILNRWDDWLKHPEYETLYNEVQAFRRRDRGFQHALHQDAIVYIERRKQRGDTFDEASVLENSINFFVEEVAGYILIARTYGALRAYPARDMACFAYMRGPDIPAHLRGLEKAPHIELNYKKKSRLEVPPARPTAENREAA